MLPILLSEGVNGVLILKILGIKILIGIIAGFLIDLISRKNYKNEKEEDIENLCEHEHCHCEEGIWKSTIKHTVNVLIFILIISLMLNIIISVIGEEALGGIISDKLCIICNIDSIILIRSIKIISNDRGTFSKCRCRVISII